MPERRMLSGTAALFVRKGPRLFGDCSAPDHCPITPGCFDVPGSGQRLTDIADCGNSEARIGATLTLASGKSRAVDSESTQTGGLSPCSAMDENRYLELSR